ncbi:bifunctional MFS transporter/dTMP kinase [Saccharothrix lopnurensis]|uniref:Thymidylate kinase n=1 Tax=Saccharothrix lopnurensis TaxID=1670621 RepID=A0ABW1NXN0_9PSEU
MSTIQDSGTAASTSHRIRGVLAIRPFRRLWGVTYLCSVGDWLSFLALTGLVTQLTDSYQWQSFSLSLVVLTQLLPGILFAPVGGVLADRFDRRKVMVVCDLLRGALFISIALVGTAWWLFIANFLVGCCAMLWIPSKDSAVPNLMRRPAQVETANQLGLVMTYGISVISASGLYALISGIPGYLHLQSSNLEFRIATIAVMVNGALYVTAAILVATRIPELSGRIASENRRRREDGEAPGFFAMMREGLRYAGRTRLVRGLVIGMVGAFAAAGAVIGTAPLYTLSLLGGASTFGLLFVAVFAGLALGMGSAPRMARQLSHDRLFGLTILVAGLSLVVVAFAPHLWVALVAVAFVGASAGVAFLTGLTIVGSQVEDEMRGRTVALLQSLLKVVLAISTATVPLLVSLVQQRTITVFGHPMQVDGTRPVLLGAGLLAALLGLVAYRQMDDRRSEPILSDLLAAFRGRGRHKGGVLIAVEGDTRLDTATQARRLAEALRADGRDVLLASDPDLDEQRLRNLLTTADLAGVRAHALVAAAVRADVVEREVRPALDRGALVVMERYVDSPLAHFSAVGSVEPREVEGLVDWATGRLRPDVTVLLDRTPSRARVAGGGAMENVEHHWRVRELLAEMAAADPERYVVVDADATEDEIADRVARSVLPLLSRRAGMTSRPVAETS